MIFDVFLAHNTEDKPQVRKIAQELKRRNLTPWLDEEQIRAGQIFQLEIQNAIQNSKTAVIFIGKKGLGRWQNKELPALYGQFVEAESITTIIPVLLLGVDEIPQNLLFLKQHHWVSFANGINDEGALNQLEWGIRGESLEKNERPENREIHRELQLVLGLFMVGFSFYFLISGLVLPDSWLSVVILIMLMTGVM